VLFSRLAVPVSLAAAELHVLRDAIPPARDLRSVRARSRWPTLAQVALHWRASAVRSQPPNGSGIVTTTNVVDFAVTFSATTCP
jgi:hypothetical protein